MKKNKLYSYGVVSVLLLLFTGCNSFLDKAPDDRLTVENLDMVNELITSAYQNDRSYRGLELCTDNAEAVEGAIDMEPIIEDLYTWRRIIRDQTHQDAPTDYWYAAYGSIATVNQALKSLEEIDIVPEDQYRADLAKGEALIIRAYNHFMLVNIFCKHYDPATAAADLGIPYATQPETTMKVNYERGTVEGTYEKIETDLKEGIKLLEKHSEFYNPNKYHFTLQTVYLFASRYYTFRNKDEKDVENAIKYAEKSIAAFGGPEVMRYWKEYQSNEYLPIDIDQSDVGLVQNSATWVALPYSWAYGLTNTIARYELTNPFGFKDERLQIGYRLDGDGFAPAFYYTIDNTTSTKSATDLFPLSEAILNAAEGYARQNDIDNALKYVRYIGEKVYSNFRPSIVNAKNLQIVYETASAQEAVLSYILFERRLQFLYKGMRWFDLKRYHMDVMHTLIDGTTLKLSEVAPQGDFQIPNTAISTGMQPND